MQVTSVAQPPIRVISNHGFSEVVENSETLQKSLIATRSFKKGDLLCDFGSREEYSTPNYLTVQLGNDRHILLDPEFLQYINHSCDPNVFFDTDNMKVWVLKDIVMYEEFSFFYPSAEWEMRQSFRCHCGTDRCLGEIRGAKFIDRDISDGYRLTGFIDSRLNLNK